MDYSFCADIHATGRFIDDEDGAFAREPFGERDFLLIPAAEAGDRRVHRWSFDAQTIDITLDERALLFAAHETRSAEPAQHGKRSVLATIHAQHQTEAFAIFG